MPVSRILYPDESGRLSFIWDSVHTLPLSANPHTSGEPPSGACLFGISARKVYPHIVSPRHSVVSYTTFSPLPQRTRAVILCGTVCSRQAGTYPLGSALLCTVRTFLRQYSIPAIARHCSCAKLILHYQNVINTSPKHYPTLLGKHKSQGHTTTGSCSREGI